MLSEYSEQKPTIPELRPYIENYKHLAWNATGAKSKDFLPRPGVSMIFTDKTFWVDDQISSNTSLIGIHDEVHNIKWLDDQATSFVIRFSPYGISRFLQLNMHELANHFVDSEALWGTSIKRLCDEIMTAQNMSQRVERVERFFTKQFIMPTTIEEHIFQFADRLRDGHDALSLDELRQIVPLSTRQLERRFKVLIGVNLQTYMRLCRFDYAKSLLTRNQYHSLTDIGYASGYSDQAHFSNEFKRLSAVRPKHFLPSSPFHQSLAEHRFSAKV